MNYTETRNRYLEYRENMVIAERDELVGVLQQIPIVQKEIKTKKITSKRERILFVRDYMKEYGRITAKGLARKREDIFRNTRRKPDEQLVKDFTVILTDLVSMGILKKYGSYRGNVSYIKVKPRQ